MKAYIQINSTDQLLEALGWITLVAYWAYVLWQYGSLPESIPTHFNAMGKPDHWDDKNQIFLVPVVFSVIFIGMSLINRHPEKLNYSVKITEENAERQYSAITRMLRWMKTVLLFMGLFITYQTIQTTNGQSEGLGSCFLPLALLPTVIPVVYFLNSSKK